MAATSWPAALAFVWSPGNDGTGPHTEPGDSGGLTNMGVTAATWSDALDLCIVHGQLEDAELPDLAAVLRRLIWNPVKGDVLPAGVDVATFNVAMVAGPRAGAKLLQGACGAPIDGIIGPVTLAYVGRAPVRRLICDLTEREEAFYAACPTAPQFLRGWDRRAEDCRVLALKLAGLAEVAV